MAKYIALGVQYHFISRSSVFLRKVTYKLDKTNTKSSGKSDYGLTHVYYFQLPTLAYYFLAWTNTLYQ